MKIFIPNTPENLIRIEACNISHESAMMLVNTTLEVKRNIVCDALQVTSDNEDLNGWLLTQYFSEFKVK